MSYLSNFHHQFFGSEASEKKLVFLHGVMGFAANFRRIAKAFEANYQVLTYDQRGHGRSFQPESGYAPEDYAGDLLKIIDELGWKKIYLVGHSMGGRAAMNFAFHNPDRVTRLVIADIGPSMNQEGPSFVTKMVKSVPVPFASKREAREWLDTKFLELYAKHPKKEQLAEYIYANLTENDAKEAVWRFYPPGILESTQEGRMGDRWNEVEGLKIPTLFIRGEKSTDLPRDVYDHMLKVNPLIEGVEFAGAGHWVHADQPDLFISEINAFFDNNQGAR